MRARSRNEIAFIVLIAIIAAGVPALAFRFVPAAAGAGAPSTASGPAAAGPRDTVIVIGEGSQMATPDIAILNLRVQPKRPSVREALSAANAEMDKLLANIKASVGADADIQTTSLGISQNTDCCATPISGYPASQSGS